MIVISQKGDTAKTLAQCLLVTLAIFALAYFGQGR